MPLQDAQCTLTNEWARVTIGLTRLKKENDPKSLKNTEDLLLVLIGIAFPNMDKLFLRDEALAKDGSGLEIDHA